MEKVGRNDPCPCGSGQKFKKCCESKVAKRSIGAAQVLSGASKMSSFFQRHITPLSTPQALAAPAQPNEETPATTTV
ncbi:MAG: SEC-C domain-containing protein [Verrucomicrobia bacterium]|nr:SEC-C domain-containing protein [Verrucomicrobiota bacterium]